MKNKNNQIVNNPGCDDILKNIPGHVYWKDKNGIYLGCNIQQAITLGLSKPEDIVGKSDVDFYGTKGAEFITNIDKQVMNNKTELIVEEPVYKQNTGETIYYLSKKSPLFNENHEVIGIIGVSINISTKTAQLAELVLQKNQSEVALHNIISLLPGNIYWKDMNGVFLGCNQQQAESVGFTSPHELIGKTAFDTLPEEQARKITEIDQQLIKTGNPVTVEEISDTSENKSLVYLSKKIPLRNNKKEIIGILGVSFDITERKVMEEELRRSKEQAESANQAKTEFLSNMRHDIRTPLSGIVGFSEILKSESSEPRIKEYADNLIASSHALLDLMDEVLEAVRVSSGEIPMLKKKFNLAQVFEQVVALYQAKAHEKRLKLTLELDNKLPNFVIGDKIRLHRIALELVGNALNFTDDGHVTLSIGLAKQENRNIVIKMTVTDSGMGIPKEKQQEIYVQFKRLTPSYQGIYKGAGLGLYVVKQFIDELGGEIYVDSQPHQGTCFTCLIPLQEPLLDDDSGIDQTDDLKTEKPYMTPLSQQLTPTQEESNTTATTNVLVVEDNPIAQLAAKRILSSMACRVDVASNGDDALTLCQEHRYHLIFMDIGLGVGMDGYEVTNHIRKRQDMVHTPIIALTAHAGDENKQRCIESGMDAVLTKPLTQAQAADILKAFVPSRQSPSTAEEPPKRRDLPDSDEELFYLDQFALFDKEQGLKNSGDNAMLIELLTMMVTTEIPTDLAEMQSAFASNDFPSVEKLAHKIKGGAVYVGTTRMKYACQYLERYWKAGERKLFNELYHQAVKIIEETKEYVSSWLNENKIPTD